MDSVQKITENTQHIGQKYRCILRNIDYNKIKQQNQCFGIQPKRPHDGGVKNEQKDLYSALG